MAELVQGVNLVVPSQSNLSIFFESSNIIQNFIFKFDWSALEFNGQKSIVLNPLNVYKFYDVSKLSHTIKFIISIHHSKLVVVYKLAEMTIQIITSTNKETYLLILL